MNTKKLTLTLLVLTVVSFSLSYVAARIGGLGSEISLPLGLAQKYTEQFQGKEGKIHREIDAPAIEEVRIETTATDIEVVPSEDTAVRVDVEGIIVTGREELDDALKVNIDGKTLVLGLDEEFANQVGPRFRLELGPKRLIVKVPATVKRLSLQSQSGDVEVRELILMNVQAESASGEVGIREATVQNIRLRSTSGDVTAQGTFDVLDASTTSGDLNVDFQNAAPQGQIGTTSGDLRLNFRQKPKVALQYETQSGDIQIEDEMKKQTDRDQAGLQAKVRVTTTSGDLTITQE